MRQINFQAADAAYALHSCQFELSFTQSAGVSLPVGDVSKRYAHVHAKGKGSHVVGATQVSSAE